MNDNLNHQVKEENQDNRGVRFNTTFIRTKIIHGIAYLYEITPYWDYKANKQRQRSKYIGRADKLTSSRTISSSNHSSSTPSNPISDNIEQNTDISLPTVKHLVDFGDAYLYKALVEELSLPKILKQCFTEEEANFILLAAGYRLLCGKAFSIMESWLESSELQNMFPVSFSLSSPAVSNHLAKLGCGDAENIFSFLPALVKSV